MRNNKLPSTSESGTPDIESADRLTARGDGLQVGDPDREEIQTTAGITTAGRVSDGLVPAVPREEIDTGDRIHVAAGGLVEIPREDIDLGDGEEEEISETAPGKIRKPGRREYIIINPALELPTRLLLHKPKGPDSIDTEYYYVDPSLKKAIFSELKPVRVVVYYSTQTKTYALWIINVTLDNSYYDSLQAKLLRQPPAFFEQYEVRVYADQALSKYRVKKRPRSVPAVLWPDRPTGVLLAEALGRARHITSADHTIYADLVSGEEVEE